MFEITEEEFEKFKQDILTNFNDVDKVQFKDLKSRNKAYVMIDNLGNAWIPIYELNLLNNYNMEMEERKLIGNINDKKDWETICKQLKKIRR